MKTVLVTGANGQLARCIKDLTQDNPKFIFKTSKELDVTNKESIFQLFNKHGFGHCINCAAYTNVDKAETDLYNAENVNTNGPKYLAEACKINETVLLHVSTDFVFDGTKQKPYSEKDVTNPINTYGLTKRNGENEIINTLNEHFIIRTSWLYSEYGKNFLTTMLKFAKTKGDIKVVNDQLGSPTYAKDLADIIVKIILSTSNKYGLYHYSNEGEISWHEFALEIARIGALDLNVEPISSKAYITKAERPNYSVLDITKSRKNFDIEINNWKDSLKKAFRYL